MRHRIAISFDVDWAPDWMLADVFDVLRLHEVRSTWFLTHRSDFVDQVICPSEWVEVGLHPNFLPGSSQGQTYEEVFETMLSWFPGSKVMRTHSLYQSERLLELAANKYGIQIDCSIYAPGGEHIEPHKLRYTEGGRPLFRIPHFYQDNMDVINGTSFHLDDLKLASDGLKVFNFHPIHLALNTNSMAVYERMRSKHGVASLTRDELSTIKNNGIGVSDLFQQLVKHIAENNASYFVSDLIQR